MTDLVGIQDGVCGGRPTIIGHRIEVRHVLAHLAGGDTVQDIADSFDLTIAQVLACCAYAAWNGLPPDPEKDRPPISPDRIIYQRIISRD